MQGLSFFETFLKGSVYKFTIGIVTNISCDLVLVHPLIAYMVAVLLLHLSTHWLEWTRRLAHVFFVGWAFWWQEEVWTCLWKSLERPSLPLLPGLTGYAMWALYVLVIFGMYYMNPGPTGIGGLHKEVAYAENCLKIVLGFLVCFPGHMHSVFFPRSIDMEHPMGNNMVMTAIVQGIKAKVTKKGTGYSELSELSPEHALNNSGYRNMVYSRYFIVHFYTVMLLCIFLSKLQNIMYSRNWSKWTQSIVLFVLPGLHFILYVGGREVLDFFAAFLKFGRVSSLSDDMLAFGANSLFAAFFVFPNLFLYTFFTSGAEAKGMFVSIAIMAFFEFYAVFGDERKYWQRSHQAWAGKTPEGLLNKRNIGGDCQLHYYPLFHAKAECYDSGDVAQSKFSLLKYVPLFVSVFFNIIEYYFSYTIDTLHRDSLQLYKDTHGLEFPRDFCEGMLKDPPEQHPCFLRGAVRCAGCEAKNLSYNHVRTRITKNEREHGDAERWLDFWGICIGVRTGYEVREKLEYVKAGLVITGRVALCKAC